MDPNHFQVDDSLPYYNALTQCIDHWGLVLDKTELVRDGVNHVFATERVDGAPVIIRISDGNVRERGEVLGELLWLDHLISHGCTVTTPILSRGGELLESIEVDEGTMHVCCFQRFGGRQLNPATDAQWNDELFVRLGREIGRIHRASDDLQLPADHDRLSWHEIRLGQFPDPLPDFFHPQVVEAMRVYTDEWKSRPKVAGHYGLVHRDLHAGNFLVENGEVQIIDFDLGCYGWRTMDLAVLLFIYYYYPSLRVPGATAELAGHVLKMLVQGYREEYPLEREQLETVGDMFMLNSVNNYFLMLPEPEHWQVAMGNPRIPVTESLAWIEQLWLDGRKLEIDIREC
ncbi:serine/threonine protein kinase [Gimesia panareensis]|uniref:Serine/threonine protein kinase n=1 Tax=Gimesia panareensis TaxID=2527978 RepID=A0A518FZ53_9PLAN|nr:phosphotransferase [Gimesia panareensis]QDV21645.1 serine/threonine protein kinase [Gimesia panareensis]